MSALLTAKDCDLKTSEIHIFGGLKFCHPCIQGMDCIRVFQTFVVPYTITFPLRLCISHAVLSVAFRTFPLLCNNHLYLVPAHFHHLRRKPRTHFTVNSLFSSPLRPLAPPMYFLSLNLFWIFHMNGCLICGLLCLAFFT